MAGTTVVTPELLRSTKQRIESRLQEAAAIVNQYLSGHENIISATGWSGQAGTTSLNSAGQIAHDLQQMMVATVSPTALVRRRCSWRTTKQIRPTA
jgi:hypothetical protein